MNLEIKTPPDATRFATTKAYELYDNAYRPPMGSAKVGHVQAIPPKADITHPESLLVGVAKRMAYDPPRFNRATRRRFEKFVDNWLLKNIEPFAPTETFDFDEWLATVNHPDWRKQEIKKARRCGPYLDGEIPQGPGLHSKYNLDEDVNYVVKLFTKEEYYPEYKHHRGIWAREDAAKAVMGPFFAKIEKVLFKLPYFIKKIPKNDRPAYIQKFMDEVKLKFHTSDYTSFESHFTTDMMDSCEFKLYRHMSKNNIQAQRYCQLIFRIIAATNVVINKYFTILVDVKR